MKELLPQTLVYTKKAAAHFIRGTMRVKRKLGAGASKKKRGRGLRKSRCRKRGRGCRKKGGGCRKNKKGGYLLSLLGTAMSAYKIFRDMNNSKKATELQKQHYQKMEEMAKAGKGLFLRPYRGGGKKKEGRSVFYKG